MQYQPPHQTKQQDYIRGTIEKIVSHDFDTGYTVLKVLNSKTHKRLESVIVHHPAPYVGVKMIFHGEWHFQNGSPPIFHADFAYEQQPKTLTEIRKYLRSGIIKGLGNSTVKNIVRHFGENTLELLDKNIERLTEVEGISDRKIPRIMESRLEHNRIKEAMHFLQSHKLKCIYAVQTYKLYEESTIEKVQENPYRLLQDIQDISFFDVDPVALSMGIKLDNKERLSAAIMHIFAASKNFGHCYLTSAQIYEQIHNLLKQDISEKLSEHLRYMREQQLVKTRKLHVKGSDHKLCYYEPEIFFDESYVAKKISRNNIPPEVNLEWIKDLANRYRPSELELSDEQAEAVIGIVCSKYSILTGGPGTGKSSILKLITYVLKKMALTFSLVAPTGRAAQRMTELIGKNAQTIHRLLGYWGDNFRYNEKNPLDTNFVIIDESSMLDINLTASLLKAVPDNSQVLFVGDADQLPAIGPGNVLKDIIDSKAVNVYRLTQIFRQDEGSLITEYATQINRGLVPRIESPIRKPNVWKEGLNCLFVDSDISPENQTHFFQHENEVYDIKECEEPNPVLDGSIDSGEFEFRKKEPVTPYDIRALLPKNHRLVKRYKSKSDAGKEALLFKKPHPCSTLQYEVYAEDTIEKLYTEIIPKEYGDVEIQVLTPMTKKSLGTGNLNRLIQNASNPYAKNKSQLKIKNKTFRTGDRVIHCHNNYDLKVFNGEIGTIKDINNKDFACSVKYQDNRIVKYEYEDLWELDHAYAITIHKAQGSEFDVVIIPIHEQHHRMLFRSLFYTAITRARNAVIFVGERSAFEMAVKNRDRSLRQTGLKELLIT